MIRSTPSPRQRVIPPAAWLLAAACAAAVICPPAGAQRRAAGQGSPAFAAVHVDSGPLGLLLPKLASAPAPSWVKPGVRLTYYGASASVAGSGKSWQIDPEGGFQTPDGRRWSASD